jgi:hypothetical protein
MVLGGLASKKLIKERIKAWLVEKLKIKDGEKSRV